MFGSKWRDVVKDIIRTAGVSCMVYLVASLLELSLALAQPRQVRSASEYVGTCRNIDSKLSEELNFEAHPCDSYVLTSHFADGHTGIQFNLISQVGNRKRSISFAGPIWYQVDEIHKTMVIEEVVMGTTALDPKSLSYTTPNEPFTTNHYSGFCLLTSEPSNGPVSNVLCQYLTGSYCIIFRLDDITSRTHIDVN